jgi:hypothetical protein
MFMKVVFTILKLWNQTKCPLTEEWIKKKCGIGTTECYSATKKNKIIFVEK